MRRYIVLIVAMLKLPITSIIFSILSIAGVYGQTSVSPAFTFIDYQRSIPKVTEVMNRRQDTLMSQFRAKGLEWPAKYIYIRSFKYDSQMEVWVKNSSAEPYKLFKTYKVCALAGTLGPKRMQGDYQVPEGLYHINELNPNSMYHLSLGLNYPNASDRMLSDSLQPGGDIYIHGSCVTTGCIPITNNQIEDLYILAAYAKNQGQDFIPVHIFPINFNNPRSVEYLKKHLQTFSDYTAFANTMKNVFYYFERYRQVPPEIIDSKGEYVIDEQPVPNGPVKNLPKQIVKKKRVMVDFDEKEIPSSVNHLPVYPGGAAAFKVFLDQLSKKLVTYLPEEQHTAFVMIEFIVTKEGKVINPKIVRGGNDEMNEHILDAFEAMPVWTPAERQEKNVPIKLKQTIAVEAK